MGVGRAPAPGDPLRVRAADYSRMLQAADALPALLARLRASPIQIAPHVGLVFGHNGTDDVIDRFTAAGVSGSVMDSNSPQFQERIAVELRKLTQEDIDTGKWVIAASDFTKGVYADIWASGRAILKVNVSDTEHTGFMLVAGSDAVSTALPVHGKLLTTPAGGLGVGLCIVAISAPGLGVEWGKAKAKWANDGTDTGNGCFVTVEPVKNRNGDSFTDVPPDVKVYLLRNGRREDPNIREGETLAFMRTAPEDGGGTLTGVALDASLDGKCGESLKLLDKNATIPAGWEEVGDASKRTVSFNSDPDLTGETGGEDTVDMPDIEHEDIDVSTIIQAHELGSLWTDDGNPPALVHSGSLTHGRLDHSGTLSHDDVALPDHSHDLYTDMRQASGLQMESTAIQSQTKGVTGTLPTHTHKAHDAYGSISAHSPAAHDAAQVNDHTISDLTHKHKMPYGATLEHSGVITPLHKEYTLNKWQKFYTAKLIRRKD